MWYIIELLKMVPDYQQSQTIQDGILRLVLGILAKSSQSPPCERRLVCVWVVIPVVFYIGDVKDSKKLAGICTLLKNIKKSYQVKV